MLPVIFSNVVMVGHRSSFGTSLVRCFNTNQHLLSLLFGSGALTGTVRGNKSLGQAFCSMRSDTRAGDSLHINTSRCDRHRGISRAQWLGLTDWERTGWDWSRDVCVSANQADLWLSCSSPVWLSYFWNGPVILLLLWVQRKLNNCLS